jgi:pimeloyl-ACP methyl ester carboxylesterase
MGTNPISNPKLRAWQAAGTQINLDGDNIFLRDEGTGPVLLMIHGFPMSSWDWKDVFAPLSENYHVVAPDMLGYGFSDKPTKGDYSTRAQSRRHSALLRALNISNVHILTYSFGCSVTQQLMCDTMEGDADLNIRSVTFMNGGLFPASNHPNPTQMALISPKGPQIAARLTRKFLEVGLPPIFGPDTQPSDLLINDYWELLCLNEGYLRLPQLIGYLNDRTDFAESWKHALINHPAKKQLIAGLVDEISGPKMVAEYRATVPDAKIRILEKIGHYPQIEASETVIKAVQSFAV